MKDLDFLKGLRLGCVIFAIIGVLGSMYDGNRPSRYSRALEIKTMPQNIRVQDVNHDGIADLVVESAYRTNIFLGNSNNSYISFEKYKINQETNLENSFLETEQNALRQRK